MQRRVERQIRKQKRLRDAYEAAGLTEDAQTANIKLRRLNAKYKEFSKAAGLPEQRERLKVLYVDDTSTAAAETLKLKRVPESATISASIGTPINSRNSAVGRPNAVSILNSKLSKRQEALLNELPNFDSRIIVRKKAVSMKDLAALTAKTGNEFAMFTKGGKRLVIRGNSQKVNINHESARELYELGYKWSGHTHPGDGANALLASGGDCKVLAAFRQKCSVIYDAYGKYEIFEV